MFWTLILELIEWNNIYKDSLAHQEREVLGYEANISRYLYCGIHKCFHRKIDWEQYVRYKARLVAQGVYAKPRHWFSMLIFSKVSYKFPTLTIQKHLSLQLIDVVIAYNHLIWYIFEASGKEFTYQSPIHKSATHIVYCLSQYTA